MYKKVFHKKFQDQAEATAQLDANGWVYVGPRGIFRRYHLYTGVTMMYDGRVSEHHRLRLYADGYVALYNDYDDKGTLGTSGLPARVWASKDIHDHLENFVQQNNEKLSTEFGNQYFIENVWHQKYAVYKLQPVEHGSGKTIMKPACKILPNPQAAYEWAVSNSR